MGHRSQGREALWATWRGGLASRGANQSVQAAVSAILHVGVLSLLCAMQHDDSARHSQLAQYSQKTLQAGENPCIASSMEGGDIEAGIRGRSDLLLDDSAGELYPPTNRSPTEEVSAEGDADLHISSGDRQLAARERIRDKIRGASLRSMTSNTSNRSLNVQVLGAAGLFTCENASMHLAMCFKLIRVVLMRLLAYARVAWVKCRTPATLCMHRQCCILITSQMVVLLLIWFRILAHPTSA